MLEVLMFVLAGGPALALVDSLELAQDDPRMLSTENDVAAARARVPSSLSWLAPVVTGSVRVSEATDPLLSPGYLLVPIDLVHRRALDILTSSSWISPLGTELNVRLGFGLTDTDDVYAPLKVTYVPEGALSLRQHLLRGGGSTSRLAGYNAAAAGAEEAAAAQQARRRTILANIGAAYFDLVRAQETRAIRNSSVELGLESQRLSEQLVQIGVASQVDLAAADQGVAARRLELERSERDLAAARIALVIARGRSASPTVLENAEDAQPAASFADWCVEDFARPAALAEIAVARDPELAVLGARLRSLDAQIGGSANAELPDVTVGLEGTARGLAGSSNCGGGFARDGVTPCAPKSAYLGTPVDAFRQAGALHLYTLNAVAAVTLPAWGEPASAQTRALRAESASVAAQMDERRRILRWVVQNAALQLAQSRAVLAQAAAADTAAHAAVDAEVQKLRVGRSTVLDVLRTQDGLLAVSDQKLDALIGMATSIFVVRMATTQITDAPAARLACIASVAP